MKKKHIGLKIFLVLFALLLMVTIGIFIRFYPVYKDAKFLAEKFSLTCLTYEFEAEINREELQENQVKLLDTLAELTGYVPPVGSGQCGRGYHPCGHLS